MTGAAVTGAVSPGRLRAVSEPDQVVRRDAYLAAHPHVEIYALGPAGPWQADITEGNGSTVITRYSLGELLDALEARP